MRPRGATRENLRPFFSSWDSGDTFIFRFTWHEETKCWMDNRCLRTACRLLPDSPGRKPLGTEAAGHWRRLHPRWLVLSSLDYAFTLCRVFTRTQWEPLFPPWRCCGSWQYLAWKLSTDCTISDSMSYSTKRTTARRFRQISSCATTSSTRRCASRTCSDTKPWTKSCSRLRLGSRWSRSNATPTRGSSSAPFSLPCAWTIWTSRSNRAGLCARASRTAARPWCPRSASLGRRCWTATVSHSIMTCAYRLQASTTLCQSPKKVRFRETVF